jgi:hypothetical protein
MNKKKEIEIGQMAWIKGIDVGIDKCYGYVMNISLVDNGNGEQKYICICPFISPLLDQPSLVHGIAFPLEDPFFVKGTRWDIVEDE